MLAVENVYIGYDGKDVVEDFSYTFDTGSIVTIIGPNGSGKSTILKSISRLINCSKGKIKIYDKDIKSYNNKSLSRIMAMLSQVNSSPSDFTVKDLVEFGRTPYRKWYENKTLDDEKIVNWAIEMTKLEKLQNKKISCLSGGERQRAWIAMALSQKPKILLLDEPTTYLDISHQFEVMELVKKLNEELGITVIMVLHDLNQASMYSDKICVLKEGKLVKSGTPEEVFTKSLIKEVYNVNVSIDKDINTKKLRIVPIGL